MTNSPSGVLAPVAELAAQEICTDSLIEKYAKGKESSVEDVRLRVALTQWANNSRHDSPWAACIYAKARARGCTHAYAIRILARAWVRVLWRCWQTGQPYEAARHGAAKPFLPAA